MAEEKGLSLEVMSKLEEVFEQTGIEGIKQAREVLRKAEKKKYPDKGIVLRSRLPKKHTEKLQLVIEYMYTHKYIEKNTIYNFVKFSCEQVMGQMFQVIREEQTKSRIPKGR
jgi:hypothetical protein